MADQVLASGEIGGGIERIRDGDESVSVVLADRGLKVGGAGLVGEGGTEEGDNVGDSGVDKPEVEGEG
jgi:hypothetical protein